VSLLDDKVAIVTGAAKGIGLAVASRLHSEGATVVLSDIDADGVNAAASALDSEAIVCDVRDEDAVAALVTSTADKHGHLDIFVANAGVADVAPIVRMSLEQWRAVLAVDLDGVFLCNKHAGAVMAGQGSGSIINIASIKAFGGAPGTGSYGAAKAGVVSLTKTLAIELRDTGVRVNAVCPGWLDTDMVNDKRGELEAVLGVSFDEVIDHIQGRLGQPDEIAGLVAFLASERSRFSSGTTYVADGGATASLV